jgi:hypothetical protein
LHTDFWLKILDRKKHLGKQAYMWKNNVVKMWNRF